jgi:tetratricopeptide (TPR) repeat protein
VWARYVSIALLLALTSTATAHAQDFDPRGHRHTRPPAPHPPAPPRAAPHEGTPGTDADRGPTQAALIERYTRVVLSQPGSPFPLERLAQLYRERDGNISRLLTDFETASARPGADQYAATVTLAGLYKLDGSTQQAIDAYEKAIGLNANDARAVLALARLLDDRADPARARARYEQALALQTARTDKEQTLRILVGLALDARDWTGAKAFHRELLKLEPTSLFVRGELGRELYRRGEYVRAEAELTEVVAAAAGDNRALAPALKELGLAQAKAHENQQALATLQKALAAAGPQTALRAEIYDIVAGIYRAQQDLPTLVKQLEDEHPADPPRLALLGGLYEETGESARAIETYRRALLVNPRQLDLHLRMIRLLQTNGDLDRAIVEYESLVRAAPNNPQFLFEECEALLQRGDRVRALKLVSGLELRAAGDEELLARVADFYARIGDAKKSLQVLERLASATASGDPGHLVDLGDRYFQDGNAALARQTWKRILSVVQPRAKALAALGDVYIEHDLTADAVAAYKEATILDPTNLGHKKALAAAYERTHAYREARELYEEIVKKTKGEAERALARECRSRIVTLWGLEHVLEQQVPGLKRRFAGAPPDVEAGRMLAESLLHLRKLPDAEATLRQVIALVPGDVDNYLALERVLVQEAKIADAIAVLEKLAQLEPKRARELYQRMAQYAVQIYKDDEAIRYAVRAVELNPDDAEGHRRLGEMYRSKQDIEHAILEFRAAIAKNDRLFVVYFELADLLLSKGQAEDADRLFRAVVRGAPDEELIARAARLSTQINLGKGTLESLEQDFLPLAIGNPQRPIYRRLLAEIYGGLTFGLVQRVRHGTASEARDAREALARIGARAVKPLLDALADQDVSQQRIAIEVLAYVQNRNAALPLFAFATGPGEVALRTRAMRACGALADASLVPKYEALLDLKDSSGLQPELADSVAIAAVWGLARMNERRALPLLRRLARSAAPPAIRALAVLGLGMARDRSATADIAEVARSVDAGVAARAAAAYALGDLNAQAQVPMLLEMAEDGDALPRRMALLALTRMARSNGEEPSWTREAVQVMADAVFASQGEGPRGRQSGEAVARTAVAALGILAANDEAARAWATARDSMPAPDATLEVEEILDMLAPPLQSEAARAETLLRFGAPIERAAVAALRTSGDRARSVLDALGTGEGEFLPFVARGANGPAAQAARAIAMALEPNVVPLAKHPDPELRNKALVFACRSSSDAATDAVVAGLEDANEAVRRVALACVGGNAAATMDGAHGGAARLDGEGGDRLGAAVGAILAHSERWAMRVLAAQALGRLGAKGVPAASPALSTAAVNDGYALVRQAALEALASFDSAAARSVAQRVAEGDPEPRLRETAKAITR